MRSMMVFMLPLPLILLPLVAAGDPAQGPGSANSPSPPVATAAQDPGTPQASTTSEPTAPATVAASSAAPTARTQAGLETVIVKGEKVDLDRVVCRDAAPRTGSRLGGGRECHTERQWKERMHESQDITRRQQIMGYH